MLANERAATVNPLAIRNTKAIEHPTSLFVIVRKTDRNQSIHIARIPHAEAQHYRQTHRDSFQISVRCTAVHEGWSAVR